MKPPFRIAVLECDTPLEQTKASYGSYGGVFKSFLSRGADALDKPDLVSSKHGLDVSYWDVVNEQSYPKMEDIDAILMTGSRFNSFDDDPWIIKLVEFTQQVLEQDRVRIIGVCFGHQIVGRAMGAPVGRSEKGWEVSVSLVKLSEKGQELFGTDIFSLQQMHRDVVYEYPEGVEHLGSSPACEVQGMYIKGRLITVQGHPEFDKSMVREILDSRNEQNIFDKDIYNDAMDRVGHHHDGVAVGKAFINFLLED